MANEIKINLKGPQAVVAILLIAGFLVFRFFYARTTLEEDMLDKMRVRLQGEYAGIVMKGMDPGNITDEQGRKLLGIDEEKIEFKSVSARGTGDDVVARLEILVNGEPPPDGKSVRYYKLEHSMVLGWIIKWEVSSWSYYLKLF